MQKLSYIRLATYALLTLAFVLPQPQPPWIPVTLAAPDDVAALVDQLYRKRQAQEDITRTPGYETTIKSGSEVLKIAVEHVRKDGTDLSHYRSPTITLLKKDGRMKWLVSWDEKGMPRPGGFFGVLVDDKSGEIEEVPGM
jgi:hypothetical protein